jgi:signal transduction histidine kinase
VVVASLIDRSQELAMRAELAAQRETIFQNEKLSALGELLAGVAHELNNPLSVVVGHALMLREETADPEILRRIDKIGQAAERCTRIVKSFLAMARQEARCWPRSIWKRWC